MILSIREFLQKKIVDCGLNLIVFTYYFSGNTSVYRCSVVFGLKRVQRAFFLLPVVKKKEIISAEFHLPFNGVFISQLLHSLRFDFLYASVCVWTISGIEKVFSHGNRMQTKPPVAKQPFAEVNAEMFYRSLLWWNFSIEISPWFLLCVLGSL